MIFELALGIGITIIVLAFLAEYVDSTLGMGYGTILSPLFLIMGFKPLQIVPPILLSELITGLLAAFAHHHVGNVNFKPKSSNVFFIAKKIKELGYKESFKRGIPLHLKIALLLAVCSIVGTITAVFIAIKIPSLWLNIYIGFLVLTMGIVILLKSNKKHDFSWKKVFGLGLIASFNKGISGGGYGPVVMSGQILSGVKGKNAVGITSLAEGLTCFVGVVVYLLTKQIIDWRLAPYLIVGAVLSVPLSAITVKKAKDQTLTIVIGVATIILGITTLLKVLL